MYEYLDRVLKRLVREIYRLFQSYRTLPFDELNLAPMTRTLYAGLEDINFQAFLEIAQHYYREETGGSGTITAEQLREVLRTPSRVMKYSYDSESVRKRDRLVEALIATAGSKEDMSDFTFTFDFHALEKEMAIHSCSCLENPRDRGSLMGCLPSIGSHRVGHD